MAEGTEEPIDKLIRAVKDTIRSVDRLVEEIRGTKRDVGLMNSKIEELDRRLDALEDFKEDIRPTRRPDPWHD